MFATTELVGEGGQQSLPACPWIGNPYKLVSLWEMLQFESGKLFAAIQALSMIAQHMFRVHHLALSDFVENNNSPVENIRMSIQSASDECRRLGFANLAGEGERLISATKPPFVDRALSIGTYFDRVLGFTGRIFIEFNQHLFLLVPSSRSRYYSDLRLFSDDAREAYPEAVFDMEESAKCFALARWTACVFHLMRILEVALHSTADKLKVEWKGKGTLEQQQWHTVIGQIEKKINHLRELPKSEERDRLLQAYAESAAQFFYFKEAFRNHVTHKSVQYTEEQAGRILNAVMDFVKREATLPEIE